MIINEAFHSDFCVIREYSFVHFSKATLTNYIAFTEIFSGKLEFTPRKSSQLPEKNFTLVFTCGINLSDISITLNVYGKLISQGKTREIFLKVKTKTRNGNYNIFKIFTFNYKDVIV